jgi:hypothetical protein
MNKITVLCNQRVGGRRLGLQQSDPSTDIQVMKHNPLFKLAILAVVAGIAVSLTSIARAEEGKEITRTGTYTDSRGASGTASSVTTRSQGDVTRKGQWTNAAGGTGNWQSQTNWNKATHTATTNGSVTRPNGATSTWQGTAVRTAPGSVSSKGTITLANGKTVTYTGTDTRTAPGTWDKTQVLTTSTGKTIDRNVDTTVANGQGSRVATTTLPNGQVETRDSTFTQATTAIPSTSTQPPQP